MKFSFLYFFLCLSSLTGRELVAQTLYDSLRPLISKSQNIAAPKISENGKWAVLRKRSWSPALEKKDLDADTVMIFRIHDRKKPEIIGHRQNIRGIQFVGNSHLLLTGKQKTELIDLNKFKSRFFKEVRSVKIPNERKQFILHYKEEAENKLEVRNANGKLLSSVKNVSRFYTTETGQLYVVTKNKKRGFELLLLNVGVEQTLYQTSNNIMGLDIDPKEHGIILHEQKEDNIYQQIKYLDLKSSTVFPLKDVLPIKIERGFSEVIQAGESYFLRLWVPKEKEDSNIVDIWYGNDNALEKKFYPPREEVHYLWHPKQKQVHRIGSETFTRNVNLGSDRYFLSFAPFLLHDYTRPTPYQINVYDRLKNNYTVVDTVPQKLHISPSGQYILYKKNNSWFNYNVTTKAKKIIPNKFLKTPYFTTDGGMVWFQGNGRLWEYDPSNNHLDILKNFKGYQVKILNPFYSHNSMRSPCDQKLINMQKPLIIQLHNPVVNKNSYILWKEKNFDTIIPLTQNHIREFHHNTYYNYFSYIEENYNLPPRLVFKKIGEKKKVLYQSNKKDKSVLKQEIISYTNKEGTRLKGVLYYPLHYDVKKKYPMIVRIYEEQHHLSNRYPFPSYYNGEGFNIRLFLENGYFVYLPDIKVQGKEGPGVDALNCVNNALDAVNNKTSINKQKVGLIGHSFGGYETNFIATHSNRFAAYVSGSGQSDLIWAYHAYNYNFLFPDYKRIETNQHKLGSFSKRKALYFKNNPIYNVDKVTAPVLLWSGLEDKNVTSDHSMAFYNALKRNRKKVVALFYKGEGHNIFKKEAQFDLTSKIMDWFDYFLKDTKNIEWIEKGISKDAP